LKKIGDMEEALHQTWRKIDQHFVGHVDVHDLGGSHLGHVLVVDVDGDLEVGGLDGWFPTANVPVAGIYLRRDEGEIGKKGRQRKDRLKE
jgi:hypothetical protein